MENELVDEFEVLPDIPRKLEEKYLTLYCDKGPALHQYFCVFPTGVIIMGITKLHPIVQAAQKHQEVEILLENEELWEVSYRGEKAKSITFKDHDLCKVKVADEIHRLNHPRDTRLMNFNPRLRTNPELLYQKCHWEGHVCLLFGTNRTIARMKKWYCASVCNQTLPSDFMPELNQSFALISSAAIGAFAGWILGRSKNRLETVQALRVNKQWMTKTDLCVAGGLVAAGYGHLFSYWPFVGIRDDMKKQFMLAVMAAMKRASTDLEQLRLGLLQAPSPTKHPHYMEAHGDLRDDPYFWMRDDRRQHPFVLTYLKAENDYLKAAMADTQHFYNDLHNEMLQRTPETDSSVPLRLQGYYYYTKTVKGKDRKIHCRRKIEQNASNESISDEMDSTTHEEILLDENVEVKRLKAVTICGLRPSPNRRYLAFFTDGNGSERFVLRLKDLKHNKLMVKEEIKEVACCCEWSADCQHLFYVKLDDTSRPCQVWRHEIGKSPTHDCLIYTEEDLYFSLSLKKTRDLSLICFISSSLKSNEWRVVNASNPEDRPSLVLQRESNVEYWLEHRDQSYFFHLRDLKRPNGIILVASVYWPGQQTVLIPHREDTEITSFVLSKEHLTVFVRKHTVQTAMVYKIQEGVLPCEQLCDAEELRFEEGIHTFIPGPQGDFESSILRVIYSSLNTPESIIDQDMRTFDKEVKKIVSVSGGFDEFKYVTDRKWALAEDRTQIPISLVYSSNLSLQDGNAPLLLQVHGAYGQCLDPYFSTERLSLLDKGFIFAFAHVRGGGELGRDWYEQGQRLNKHTTFTDTIACAEYLIKNRYCHPSKLCIYGRSVGGLAVGAVLNMRPDLFHAAILESPFLDVLTTVSDKSLLYTLQKGSEWGDASEEDFYRYIKRFSPMDNISHADYPHILITCALHDARIGYWEAAKFTAKLREWKTDSNLLLLKIDMDAGHGPKSSRSEQFKLAALQYSFLCKALGLCS